MRLMSLGGRSGFDRSWPVTASFLFLVLMADRHNTTSYHENSAYFDGHYPKIAAVSDRESQVVIQATRPQP